MEKAKRARKAETPKRPSLSLRLRAPYLYPDQRRDLLVAMGPDRRHPVKAVACRAPRFAAGGLDRDVAGPAGAWQAGKVDCVAERSLPDTGPGEGVGRGPRCCAPTRATR